MNDSDKISDIKNLGHKCENRLNSIGIYTRGDLRNFGIIEAYLAVSMQYPHMANLMFLYAMEAGMRDIHVFNLPESIKKELRKAIGRE